MALTDTWDAGFEASPSGTDDIADGDNRLRELKRALRERNEKSHYIRDTNNIYGDGLIDDEEGRNIPGNTPAVFIGTLAAINALTGLEAINGGELAFDTDSDILRVHDGTDWTTRTISSDVTGGPIITAATVFANLAQTGWDTDPIADASDLTEITNDDDVALATTGSMTGTAATAMLDLGAVFQGTVKFLASVTGTASTSNSVALGSFFDNSPFVSVQQDGVTYLSLGTFQTAVTNDHAFILPFYGRKVGLVVGKGGSGTLTMNIKRLEIHGVAV